MRGGRKSSRRGTGPNRWGIARAAQQRPSRGVMGDVACPHRGGKGVADVWDPAGSGRGREERGAGARGPTWEKVERAEPG
jgi:hypothetical protein